MIEQKTLTEMKDTLTKLQVSSKSDVDKCIRLRDELKQLQDAIQDISDKSKLELSFIATQKCKDKIEQSTTFLKKNPLQIKGSKTFQLNSKIKQYLSKLSGLGRIKHSTQPSMAQENPNKVFTVHIDLILTLDHCVKLKKHLLTLWSPISIFFMKVAQNYCFMNIMVSVH
ncbi:hypothetical protein DPMN_183962 [Dreissena polymorpha]|uniref:Uncharacterized protein n=1 Tax=Dreissena polymorpha TaxID=45954 RepID=A0A9D4DKV6_DREPO|nr:hypothetical protein DPMN_183962 [Dreissena polymorpha]